ncbi:50S ribosomal protein [Musa troglodytarum]|uniref:50S ribosomal protein n=1 Tax=Musa troglodytarum TaxID=320322 RepID=A0A9E7GJY9_9LILI|nr:50S ribosomal protein [Musa troglodytarum]
MTSFMKLGPPRLHAQDVFAILFSSILFSLGPRADTPFRARRTMVSQLFKHERIETTVAKRSKSGELLITWCSWGRVHYMPHAVLLLLFVVMIFFINCSQSLLIATSKCSIHSPCFACYVAGFGENFVINIRD